MRVSLLGGSVALLQRLSRGAVYSVAGAATAADALRSTAAVVLWQKGHNHPGLSLSPSHPPPPKKGSIL